jgi:hypothetical protein
MIEAHGGGIWSARVEQDEMAAVEGCLGLALNPLIYRLRHKKEHNGHLTTCLKLWSTFRI